MKIQASSPSRAAAAATALARFPVDAHPTTGRSTAWAAFSALCNSLMAEALNNWGNALADRARLAAMSQATLGTGRREADEVLARRVLEVIKK